MDFLILLTVGVLGYIIGYNQRNASASAKEAKLFEQVDEEVRNRLHVAENLNKSLLSDVRFLREKLKRLKGSE